ncbi:serine/threonine protein kinase, partial [Amycolatopsis sp. SID8362]|nr:serine/threonine protein kinase [Amycolatopsis sp. SID8362]NED39799.1 serine/threonine protein kinase [Amycolatopsis sp. SID8362]
GARKGLIAVGAGAALLCVAVVVAILLVVRQKPPADNAAPPASSSPSASVTQSAAPPPAPSSASETPTTSAPPTSPPVSSVASSKTAADALAAYYALLPNNTAEAWNLLTDRFKASRKQTLATYQNFWGQYKSVKAESVKEVGPGRVTAHVLYDGGKGETDTFTLVQENGVWKIDAQS